MIVKDDAFARAIDALDPAIRLYLVHGPDDAAARAFADRLGRRMGTDAERIDLDGATLKDDPARLADEAAAIGLFGGARWVRVNGGEECAPAVDALLAAPGAGNPVILLTTSLRANGALARLTTAAKSALVCPLGRAKTGDLVTLAESSARAMGVRLGPGVARALAADSLGNRAVIERELEKIALYLDAAPDRPRPAEQETLAAIGAALSEIDFSALVNATMSGDGAALGRELPMIAAGDAYVPALRAVARRIMLLARLRGEVDRGRRAGSVIDAAGGAVFRSERDAVTAQLQRWTSERLSAAHGRIATGEAALIAANTPGAVLAEQALLDIARVAQRLR